MKVLKSIFNGRCCDCGEPATVLVERAGHQFKICNTCLGEWEEELEQPRKKVIAEWFALKFGIMHKELSFKECEND